MNVFLSYKDTFLLIITYGSVMSPINFDALVRWKENRKYVIESYSE